VYLVQTVAEVVEENLEGIHLVHGDCKSGRGSVDGKSLSLRGAPVWSYDALDIASTLFSMLRPCLPKEAEKLSHLFHQLVW